MAWLELVKSASDQGLNIHESGLTIGRAADNLLVLNDIAVSRYHAKIEKNDEHYCLVDLGSKGGTRVNNEKVAPQTPIPLTDGDLIVLGNSAVRFRANWQYQDNSQSLTTAGPINLHVRDGQVPVLELNTPKWAQNWGITASTMLLGSHPACDIAVDGVDLAACHLRIRDCGHGLAITDLTQPQQTEEIILGIGDDYTLAPKISVTYLGLEFPEQIDQERRKLLFMPPTELHEASKATLLSIPGPSAETTTSAVPVKTIPLVGHVTLKIGRDPMNDLQISHPTVSRFHAKIERREREFTLHDLGSSNGTYVNGREVTEPVLLRVGDSIRIGCDRFVLNIDESLTQYSESGHLRLDAVNLSKIVGKGTTILHNISLSILPQEFVAILGPSGSGKSTLLDTLNGLRPATSGTVFVNGTNFYRNYQAFQTQLGYVPQRNIIHEELTIAQALDYAARLRMPPDTTVPERQGRVKEVLSELGLSHRKDVPISRLSGGQQRRVCIGAELLTQPSLFFLDEATSGLDPGTEADMMVLLRELADQGRTILIITHATQNIRECNLVIFMAEGGRLAYFGPPDQMLSYFRTTFAEEFSGIKLDDFSGIYRALDKEKNPNAPSSEDLERAFKDSAYYQEYVLGRQQVLNSRTEEPPKRTRFGKSSKEPKSRVSSWDQFLILTARNLSILAQDKSNLILTLLIAPLLGMLSFVSWSRNLFDPVAGNAGQALTMIFVTTLIAVMIGSMTTMRDLVKEVEVYRRERMIGLKILPYIGSKVAIAFILALYQAATYLLVTKLAVNIPGDWGVTFEMYITIGLAIFGGMAMGLLVSAFAPSQNIVPLLILMFLVPQIIFSGGIQPVDSFGFAGKVINHLTVIKWPFESMITLTGMGQDLATDPCWQDLSETQRGDLTEEQQRRECTCFGPGLFQTCNFPGIQAKFVPAVNEPEPQRPESPGAFPTDPAEFEAFQARMDAYQTEMDAWETEYSRWNRERSRAINEAEGTLSRFNRDQGYMFNVSVLTHWRNQGILILAMIVALPFCQKRRDFTK